MWLAAQAASALKSQGPASPSAKFVVGAPSQCSLVMAALLTVATFAG